MYRLIYTTDSDKTGMPSICYSLDETDGGYFIEAFFPGGKFKSREALSCKREKAKEILRLLAKRRVHPLHLEDIISDLML